LKSDKITVSIGLSNNIFSVGLCALLKDITFISKIHTLESGKKCSISKLAQLSESILLVDLNMLYNMLPATEEVQKWPRIILLDTNCGKENIISAILKKKLRGVIPVDADTGLLLKVLKKVSNGEICIDNTTIKNLIDGVNKMDKGVYTALTNREREIVALIGQGYRNKEIARELYICEPTVKTHLYRIFQKLNIKNRCELVAISIKDSSPVVSM